MSKFHNKYRVESHRKPNWDYSAATHYFITFCCQNQKHYLGKIENHKMILSHFGKIIEKDWHESFSLRKELILDEFILMPNHLHAIIIIDPAAIEIASVQTHGRASLPDNINAHDEQKTHGRAPLPLSANQNLFHHSSQDSNRHRQIKLTISLTKWNYLLKNSTAIINFGNPITTIILSAAKRRIKT